MLDECLIPCEYSRRDLVVALLSQKEYSVTPRFLNLDENLSR